MTVDGCACGWKELVVVRRRHRRRRLVVVVVVVVVMVGQLELAIVPAEAGKPFMKPTRRDVSSA